ncbi:MAG: ABC transporter permease subunit [Deltaproteobacteria bacterium]|nr:ABC transporter permease subunit [Deltaproteobacteria bacterium]
MNLLAIFKRELVSYFTSLIAYVVIAVFLIISGFFFWSNLAMFVMWVGSDIKLGLWQYTFHDMRLIMLLLIPLLTMRLFSEEKKLGTIELLFTNPISDFEIVMGKYLACLSIFVLMLLLTLLYPVLLEIVFSVDIGPLIAGYLGMFLLGASFMACGIFISSLTENQVVAAMTSFGVLLLLWFIDWNEGIAGEKAVELLHQISFFEHFFNFPRGVIDMADVIYYLSVISFFLFLTLRSLESRKWRGIA